ncbi:MAG: DUF2207 domain-containing protein [Bacillaceae bacterium]|nr:DUF2207 domain-containing protein [Bacillaceae bacterium]
MKKIKIATLLVIALLFLFPLQSLAVEFTIPKVEITAHLQGNGNVEVKETFTYAFDSEFNGISRLLIPQENTEITNFSALEQGVPLVVEREGEYFNIHRKGKNETITVQLHYTIQDGVKVYEDYAQFYWPFFSRENKTRYGHFKVTVYPPSPARDVIAFGYDEAFSKEAIQPDGSVVYNFGVVPKRTNGDIRIGYKAELFSAAPVYSTEPIKDQLLNEQQNLIAKAESKITTRETLSSIARIALPAFALVLFFLILKSVLEVRAKHSAIRREMKAVKALPKLVMSLPATIFFTSYNHFSPQALAAALLDLVRQGFVKKAADDHFEVVHREGTVHHERLLINWLFYTVGKGGHFRFSDLKKYTENEKNHNRYHTDLTNWQNAVKEEIQTYDFYENKKNYRIWVGCSSLIFFPFLILFPVYDLVLPFIVSLSLFCTTILYAIAYLPKTYDGTKIIFEWKQFRENYKHLTQSDWERWSEDERMRAYIYGLGIHEKSLRNKNDELVTTFKNRPSTHHDSSDDWLTMTTVGSVAVTNFTTASRAASPSTSSVSSSGSTSSGSGAGGGGGGSGAF